MSFMQLNPNKWNPKMQIAAVLALLGALATTGEGLDGLAKIEDWQPIATKAWVIAQSSEVLNGINLIQWSAAADRAENLGYQIQQEQLQAAMLQEQISVDPNDTLRAAALATIQRDLVDKSASLARLNCQLEFHNSAMITC